MEQGVVMISEKHRRMLISLSMVICLLAVIVLVIDVIIDNLSQGPCCKSIKT